MPTTITLNVSGMTCDHCVRSVTNAIEEAGGTAPNVSLDEGRATFEAENIDLDKVIANIAEEGYEATPA